MKIRYSLAVVLASAVAFSVTSQGYRLVRIPKVGQESRLRLTAEIDLLGSSATFTAIVIEKVIAVDAAGNYTIESRQTEAKTAYGGKELKVADTGTRSAVYLPTGELKEIMVRGQNTADVRLARLGGFVAPDRELKPGESWSHTYATAGEGGIAGKADYKLLKTEILDGRAAAIVEMKYLESSGASPASALGKAWIDVGNGEILRLESEWRNAPLMDQNVPLNAKVTLVKA